MQILKCFSVVMVMLGVAAGAEEKRENVIMQVENSWGEAYKNQDKAKLEKLLTSDFVFVDEDGKLMKKAEYIDSVTKIKVRSFQNFEHEVRFYGSVAVAVIRSVWNYTVDGKEVTAEFRSTDVFQKRGGAWQVVSSQDTRVAKK